MATLTSVVSWLGSHQAVLGGAVVAVLDLLFALSPSLSGNGVLHQLYVLAVGEKAK